MINETLNTYLPAVGIISIIFNILLFAKWKLADKKRKEYLGSWDKCADKLTQSYVDNSKLMSKLREFQSKRDKHKQEQSSWAKQRINLKKRIKELEEEKV
jgi:predicted transcriptional regulator